jgi:predicted phage-related endonuclease
MSRNFIVIDAEQRSDEWKLARAGRLTASAASDITAKLKDGKTYAASRYNTVVRLAIERLTGAPDDNVFVNDAMQWGIDWESTAFGAYEALTGQMAQRVGFVARTDLMIGCSPDGIIGDFQGGLELKCPQKGTHYGYVRGDAKVPAKYLPQLLHSLWVTGAEYWDFMSYHPQFPPHMQTFYVRVERTAVERELAAYIKTAEAFLVEVEAEVAACKGWSVMEETA